MLNKLLTIMLVCGIIYCTTTNPVSGDDNVIGTEKYEYTYTLNGVLYSSSTRTVTGEIEHHYAVDIKDYDNKGRLSFTMSGLSDGSSTMTGYDTTGAVVYISHTKRVY